MLLGIMLNNQDAKIRIDFIRTYFRNEHPPNL
jgi:hypothetical protein